MLSVNLWALDIILKPNIGWQHCSPDAIVTIFKKKISFQSFHLLTSHVAVS